MSKVQPATSSAPALLAAAILSRGQTAAAAARALGISAASMSRILNVKQNPSDALRRRIAGAYRVPLRAWGQHRGSVALRRLASKGAA